MDPVCMRKSPSQPHTKMHNLYYLLHIYLIEIFISQNIGTPGTDVIAPRPKAIGFSYEMKYHIMILNLNHFRHRVISIDDHYNINYIY